MPTKGNVVSFADVISLWRSLPEHSGWSEAEWVSQCVDRPELVMLGSHTTGELFAVLNIRERRYVDEEEFSSCEIQEHEWRDLPSESSK